MVAIDWILYLNGEREPIRCGQACVFYNSAPAMRARVESARLGMRGEESDIVEDVGALRVMLAALARHLECLEEWRALRQLDEREKAGSPLEAIDGVMVRGRLSKQLSEKSRVWRAYVKIEEAIGELAGPDVEDKGLLVQGDASTAELATFEAKIDRISAFGIRSQRHTASVPVLDDLSEAKNSVPSPEMAAIAASSATLIPDVAPLSRQSGGEALFNDEKALLEAVLPAAAEAVPVAPAERVISDSHQRMRVKVRAASIAMPQIIASAGGARLQGKVEVAPEGEPGLGMSGLGVGPITAPSTEMPAEINLNDALPAKGALERIRAVQEISRRAPPQEGIAGGSVDSEIWGALAPDAPEPKAEIIVQPLPVLDESFARGELRDNGGVGVGTNEAPSIVFSDPDSLNEPRLLASERMTAIETAVAQLGDPEIVGWTAPLEVAEKRAKPVVERANGSHLMVDNPDDDLFGVDEADVEIVTDLVNLQPIAASVPDLANGTTVKDESKAALRPIIDDEVDPPSYGAYRLDVEEASVEIVVQKALAGRVTA